MEISAVQKIVAKCLSSIEQPVYSIGHFQEDLRRIREFISSEMESLEADSLRSVFFTCLEVQGFKILSESKGDGFAYAVLEASLPDSNIQGLGLFPFSKTGIASAIQMLGNGRYHFARVWSPPDAECIDITSIADVGWVAMSDLGRVVAAIVMGEYFREHFYTLQYAPSLREEKHRVMQEELALDTDEMLALERRWRALVGITF